MTRLITGLVTVVIVFFAFSAASFLIVLDDTWKIQHTDRLLDVIMATCLGGSLFFVVLFGMASFLLIVLRMRDVREKERQQQMMNESRGYLSVEQKQLPLIPPPIENGTFYPIDSSQIDLADQ